MTTFHASRAGYTVRYACGTRVWLKALIQLMTSEAKRFQTALPFLAFAITARQARDVASGFRRPCSQSGSILEPPPVNTEIVS